ncbi:hypothetical protein ACFX1Q_010548 [Malus domestica]
MRIVSGELSSDELSGLLALDPRDLDDPPLRALMSEIIKVELLLPIGELLRGLLQKLLLHLLFPAGAGFALSPLVPELPSLSGCELLGGGGGGGGF